MAEELLRVLWLRHVIRKENSELLYYMIQEMVRTKEYLDPERMIILITFRNFVDNYDEKTEQPCVLRKTPKKKQAGDEVMQFENKLKIIFTSLDKRKEPNISADWI